MRPVLICCTPSREQYASGLHWTHSKSCTSPDRNQKVRDHRPIPPKVRAQIEHPAAWGTVGESACGAYAYHPEGCLCVSCAMFDVNYIQHWMDRDDDRTLEGTKR